MTARAVRGGLARPLTLALSLALGSAALLAGAVPAATAAPAKTIHPGVTVNYGDVTCTVGAVLRAHHRVYLAVPSSCGGIDLGKKGQDGCSSPQTPVGSPVAIEGAKHDGTLVYSSFAQMQLHSDTNPNRCYYNDLSLVKVDHRDRARVNAAIPGVGVPTGIVKKLPAQDTPLRIGQDRGTAGAKHFKGWELDLSSATAMFTTPDCGSSVTTGHKLVGMLLVLPKGPVSGVPAGEEPGETYNLARSIHYLRQQHGFHRVHLVLR